MGWITKLELVAWVIKSFFCCCCCFFPGLLGGRGEGLNCQIVHFFVSWDIYPWPSIVLGCSKGGPCVPEMERSWWLLDDPRSLWWSSGGFVCLGQSAPRPSSAHSSSVGSGCCHRSKEHSDCSSAYHDTHHTSGHPAHRASLPPAGGEKKIVELFHILDKDGHSSITHCHSWHMYTNHLSWTLNRLGTAWFSMCTQIIVHDRAVLGWPTTACNEVPFKRKQLTVKQTSSKS